MKSARDHDLVRSLMERYTKIIQAEFGEKLLALAIFGSVARGEARFPGSDICGQVEQHNSNRFK